MERLAGDAEYEVQVKVVEPAFLASRTASTACAALWTRPSTPSRLSLNDWTPMLSLFTPASSSLSRPALSTVPGFASAVISQPAVREKDDRTWSSTFLNEAGGRVVGVPPPKKTLEMVLSSPASVDP
jgi:hypothetical protein